MALDQDRVNKLTGGVFLIGLAVLVYTGAWWPGILFVIGACSIVQALARGHGWYGMQGGIWFVAIGIWALFDFNLVVVLAALGLSLVLSAFLRRPALTKKPVVDHSLE